MTEDLGRVFRCSDRFGGGPAEIPHTGGTEAGVPDDHWSGIVNWIGMCDEDEALRRARDIVNSQTLTRRFAPTSPDGRGGRACFSLARAPAIRT